jgi:hypothetical protein
VALQSSILNLGTLSSVIHNNCSDLGQKRHSPREPARFASGTLMYFHALASSFSAGASLASSLAPSLAAPSIAALRRPLLKQKRGGHCRLAPAAFLSKQQLPAGFPQGRGGGRSVVFYARSGKSGRSAPLCEKGGHPINPISTPSEVAGGVSHCHSLRSQRPLRSLLQRCFLLALR